MRPLDADDALGSQQALARLGPGVAVERSGDLKEVVARCRAGDVDCVVAEWREDAPGQTHALLDALAGDGPPVVVICEPSPMRALELHRRGAAECVGPGADSPLPQVVLEQLQQWRSLRERGAAERRIRSLERYNENIVQNLSSALLVVDTGGRITLCNAAAERILGASADRLRGQPVHEWLVEGPAASLLESALGSARRFRGAEGTARRADGSQVPVGVSGAPLFDADGVRLGAVAIFQDLTEIKQLQRQVLQSEKMASIGQLAAGVAHEINNPMGFIHANLFQMAEYVSDLRRIWEQVDALQKTALAQGSEELRARARELAAISEQVDVPFVLGDLAKAVRESQEGSERIRHIVRDLRDFSHRDTEERIEADVNECLESTAQIVWPSMKQLVVLEKSYAELPLIPCYPMQLKQVFMNLIVNAFQSIQARLDGGEGRGRIRLVSERRAGGIAVQVSDDGLGIPLEHQARIFDPFFTTKKVGEGTGLGLSTSFHIAERHRGTLSVESRPGEGATFTLFLPAELDGA